MKIISLRSENVKRLKVVEITPKGDVVSITGKNASGKSSVLDSIFYALAGKEAIPGEPVRKGCESARINLDLGALIVERRFTASGGTTLKVTNAEGAKYDSPQKMLDGLLGSLTFDPLAFSRLRARDQFDTLRKLVNLPIDIDAITAANEADYQKRTDINRQTKQFLAQANAILVDQSTPAEPIDESGLLDQIEKAALFNADIQRRQANRDKAVREVSVNRQTAEEIKAIKIPAVQKRCADRVDDLKRQILALERERDNEVAEMTMNATGLLESADAIAAKLSAAPPLPEPLSVSELRAGLDEAKAVNQRVESRKRRTSLLEQATQSEAAANSITAAMEARDKQKQDAIKAADMPVPGLGFGPDHVVYNGVPFDQASSAEQLRVSCAIAMASNPKLRVIRIQDGSLLDEDGLKIIAEMASAGDWQVWLERVASDGKVGIYMEDGSVKAVDGEPIGG